MRLIDADALRVKMYDEAFETDTDEQRWDSGCWIRYRMFERNVDDAPTIDAIPVEWLENRLNTLCFEAMGAGALYGDRIGEIAKSINEVMKLWQKEQEEHCT